jgi:hypothetical protein
MEKAAQISAVVARTPCVHLFQELGQEVEQVEGGSVISALLRRVSWFYQRRKSQGDPKQEQIMETVIGRVGQQHGCLNGNK